MIICRRLLSVLALSLISGLLTVSSTHAQSFQFQFDNICTFFEQIPQTEGVRSTLTEEWSGGDWDASDRVIYDRSSGRVDKITFQERTSGDWVNLTRALPAYDMSNRLETCTLQEWDTDANDWSDAARTTRTYNDDGNVERAVFESWDDNAWTPVSRIEFTSYDDSDNLLVRIGQFWDGSNWVNFNRTENTYDNNGNLTTKLEQQTAGGNNWTNDYRTTNTYDNGRLSETLEEDWDMFTPQWIKKWRTTYSYVGKSTTVTEILEERDGSNWVPFERTTTELNDDDLPTEAVVDTWVGGWVRETLEQTTYVSVNGVPKIAVFLEQTCVSGCPEAQTTTWENASRIQFSYTEVLPVELTSFTVAEADNAVRLIWTTASETNNAGFEVQRRVGAEGPFDAIGFVDGAGTTSTFQQYRFRDANLPFTTEQVTYRLKQVDLDGTTAYSPEVEFSRATPERFVLHGSYPNPFRDQTLIRYELPQPGFVRMDVFNALGQRVARVVDRHQPAGRSEVVFDANALPSGTYFVRLEVDGQSLFRQMTVVQ